IPPPTPKSAAKKPATSPMTRRRGTRPYRTPVASNPQLDELAREPGQAGVLLDVDGVLAPIVPRPEDAAVPEETRAELRRLVARYALVACISGRPAEEVARLVGVDGIAVVGEHGLGLDPASAEWADRLHSFADTVDWPIERKAFSDTFHYRLADDQEAAHALLEEVAARARAEGLVARFGRKVLELRPPVDADKGRAVRYLLAERGLRRA